MEYNEIVLEIQKLKYQIRLLALTIDYDKNPIESLIIFNDWDEEDMNKVHKIFEKWDGILSQGGKISSMEFEFEFNDQLGVSYQGLKSIVNALYKNSQWTEVCEAYVDSFGSTPALEYHSIMRRER